MPAPAAMVFGLMEVIAGAATVKTAAFEVAELLGFCTVTLSGPALPNKLEGTVAVICEALLAVVVKAVVPTYTVEPDATK